MTRRAGILGWPVTYSRSPLIHEYWLRTHGLEGGYEKLPVAPEDFRSFVSALPEAGFVGANVTVPHKEAAFGLADTASPQAERLRAANLLVFENGAVHADSTDGYGFLESLKTGADGSAFGKNWSGAPVALLGAGGASRAIVGALTDAGAPEVRLSNRTAEKTAALEFLCAGTRTRLKAVDWADRSDMLQDCGLLVNTTSLGMTGQPALEMSLDRLPDFAGVMDIVYAPLKTPLLQAAENRGLRAIDGLGMLLHQAVPSFAAWFGVTPEVTPALRKLVAADIEAGM